MIFGSDADTANDPMLCVPSLSNSGVHVFPAFSVFQKPLVANEAHMMFLFPETPSTSVHLPEMISGPMSRQFMSRYGDLADKAFCLAKAFILSLPLDGLVCDWGLRNSNKRKISIE